MTQTFLRLRVVQVQRLAHKLEVDTLHNCIMMVKYAV